MGCGGGVTDPTNVKDFAKWFTQIYDTYSVNPPQLLGYRSGYLGSGVKNVQYIGGMNCHLEQSCTDPIVTIFEVRGH